MITNNKTYNEWRRDISCLYVSLTGRVYPNMKTKRRAFMIARLIVLADKHPECSAFDALDVLITEDYLKVE